MLSQIIWYRSRINNENNAKCMEKYLWEASESELVIMKLGKVEDYLPVDAPLLDYLVTETEGPTGWKYPKLQDLRKFQDRRGLNYSVIVNIEV